jgi:hypothetical protein
MMNRHTKTTPTIATLAISTALPKLQH